MFQLRQVSLDTTVSWSLDFFLLTRLWYKNAQETDPIKTQELLYRRQSSGPDPNWKDQILPLLSSEKKKKTPSEICWNLLWLFSVSSTALCMSPPTPVSPLFFFVFDLLLELHVYKCPCYLCGVQQSHNEGNRYWYCYCYYTCICFPWITTEVIYFCIF